MASRDKRLCLDRHVAITKFNFEKKANLVGEFSWLAGREMQQSKP